MGEFLAVFVLFDLLFALDGLFNLVLLCSLGAWLLRDNPVPEVQDPPEVDTTLSV